jgi:hypothetical protein
MPPLPQHVWITPRRKHAHLRRDNRGGVPSERPGAALVALPAAGGARWPTAGAHARAVTSVLPVCAAARGPVCAAADRRHGWTAPAHGWAARPRSYPPSARQRARTDAAPCLTDPPRQGAPIAVRSGAPQGARGPRPAWGFAALSASWHGPRPAYARAPARHVSPQRSGPGTSSATLWRPAATSAHSGDAFAVIPPPISRHWRQTCSS